MWVHDTNNEIKQQQQQQRNYEHWKVFVAKLPSPFKYQSTKQNKTEEYIQHWEKFEDKTEKQH